MLLYTLPRHIIYNEELNKIKVNKNTIQFVSVIVVTYGRTDVLFNTLRQLKQLTYKQKEIIVIDQNEPEKADLISKFCSEEDINYYLIPIKGMPFARNKGIEVAKGEILFFFDDDIEIHTPNHIEACLKDFEDKKVGAVTVRVLQKTDEPLAKISEVGIFNPFTGYSQSNWNYNKKKSVENMAGCAFAIRKDLVVKLGMFNTLFSYNYYFEETEVAIRVRKLGYKILFEPDAEINHLQTQGGARINDEFSLKLAYCYNYSLLLLCNYGVLIFLKFFMREVVKRLFSYVLKGFKVYKWKMFRAATAGTCKAIKEALKHNNYIIQRRSI
jgi:GT2 family glycosyltransferase